MDSNSENHIGTIDQGDTYGSTVEPARPLHPQERLISTLSSFVAKSPEIFGAVDIFNLTYLHSLERAAVLAAVLTGVTGDDNRPAVQAIVVVVAPEENVELVQVRVRNTIIPTLQVLAGGVMPPNAQEWLSSRLKVVSAPNLRTRSLLDLINTQSEQAAVIVTDASIYRDENVSSYVFPGAATPLHLQDIWVPQVHALATAAVVVARERKMYIALDTGQLNPTGEALQELLLSVDGCGVLGSIDDDDLGSILASRVGQWEQWIRDGYLGRVLREIQDLPPSFDPHKSFLRIQILHKAGVADQALSAIREELTSGRNIDASSRVKLARIANDANASRLASDVLSPAVDQLASVEDLESALATAHESGLGELEERIVSRLDLLFPNSPGLLARRRRIMAAARDYSGIAEMLTQHGDSDADFFRQVARFLSGTEPPDYLALIASAGEETALAEAFRMLCVQDALDRRLIVHAFELALPIPETRQQAAKGERLLAKVLGEVLLWETKGTLPISYERICTALSALIERLAADPLNNELRVSLTHLVQPSVAGQTGLAILAAIVLELGSRPVALTKRKVPAAATMEWLHEHMNFVKTGFAWLEKQKPVVIGRVVMPEMLLTEPADQVVSAVEHYLYDAPVVEEDDVAALRSYLALAVSVAPHCTDRDVDLVLMRLAGGKLASAGYAQVARDLAEQTLLNSTGSARRRRLGWFAMADVYHLCHNYLEGLIALSCALAADDSADEAQAWYEATAVARFFRDLRLYDLARPAISESRKHLARMGLSSKYGHRLDLIDLQLRLLMLDRDDGSSVDLETLIEDAVQNGQNVLDRDDETAPAAALIGQLLHIVKRRGKMILRNADAIVAELRERAGGNLASLARMFSADVVSSAELLSLVKVRAAARYSHDVGYDLRDVAILASRALANDECFKNPIDTSFALELLADQGVAAPGWDESSKPPPSPELLQQPAKIACAISLQGVSVVQVGFDSNGQAVRLSAVGGHLQAPVREAADVINEERFRTWAAEFPYRYGIDDSSPNLFYTTTVDLRLSDLPSGPVVIVPDVILQSFPPNIYFLGDDFSGRTRPMAMVSSLSWLDAALHKGPVGDGRLCAWISTAQGGPESGTLPMLAHLLEPTLTDYGFTINNGPTLPHIFGGATIAVIAAHGGIHYKEGFFRIVSDEGGLRVTPRALARSVRNVDVVILFVCSGGRADKHPGAHTTLGLAKEILDSGSQSVIASPWPLHSLVPVRWLPVFLRHWSIGESIIQASFAANAVVDEYFALDPAKGLAMTVFGNPMVRRG